MHCDSGGAKLLFNTDSAKQAAAIFMRFLVVYRQLTTFAK